VESVHGPWWSVETNELGSRLQIVSLRILGIWVSQFLERIASFVASLSRSLLSLGSNSRGQRRVGSHRLMVMRLLPPPHPRCILHQARARWQAWIRIVRSGPERRERRVADISTTATERAGLVSPLRWGRPPPHHTATPVPTPFHSRSSSRSLSRSDAGPLLLLTPPHALHNAGYGLPAPPDPARIFEAQLYVVEGLPWRPLHNTEAHRSLHHPEDVACPRGEGVLHECHGRVAEGVELCCHIVRTEVTFSASWSLGEDIRTGNKELYLDAIALPVIAVHQVLLVVVEWPVGKRTASR